MSDAEIAPLILVADDVAANVELLMDQLHTLGYRTVSASDGPSAVAATFEHRPDLAILDVSMPAGDLGVDDRQTGFEVCRRIKRDPRTSRIPVIFVTALSDTTDRVKAIEAGGDDFLTKPHNRLVLGARVRSLLKLKAATDALEDSLRKLRELEKLRDDLMKMIVHDLKTPLTAVLATLEMVCDGDFGPLSGAQAGAIGDAQTKAQELLSLIGDILELAQLEEASLPLELATVRPWELVRETAQEWEFRFQQAEGTISADAPEDLPAIQADRSILRRVFANLLQNALTHSARAITVRLSARAEADGVLFTVADDGPGIPPEYHEVIFRKFERVRRGTHAPRVRSSGLGLAFCKLAVESHGGRIWVQSGPGEGSAFHFVLPAAPDVRASGTSSDGAAA